MWSPWPWERAIASISPIGAPRVLGVECRADLGETEIEEHRPRPFPGRRPDHRRKAVFGEDRFPDLPVHPRAGAVDHLAVVRCRHVDVVVLEGKDLHPVELIDRDHAGLLEKALRDQIRNAPYIVPVETGNLRGNRLIPGQGDEIVLRAAETSCRRSVRKTSILGWGLILYPSARMMSALQI